MLFVGADRDWSDVRLVLPGHGGDMRTSHMPDLVTFDHALLDETPIIVAFGPNGLTKLFDATVLEETYGDRWPDVEAHIGALDATDVHARITALADDGALVEQGAGVFAEATTLMLEPEDARPSTEALVAAMVLVLIQSELEALVGPAPGDGPAPAGD